MRDSLIGYLIGALEPEEHTEVEDSLSQNETLRGELQHLVRSLHVLREEHPNGQPELLAAPAGLARRTCQHVAQQAQPAVAPLRHEVGPPSSRGWSLLDYAVAAGVLIAAGMLVMPAINQSRFHSRLLACQDNLRQVGQSLERYSDNHAGSFPVVNQGEVAGKYGPELVELGLDGRHLICPNSPFYESQQWNELPTKDQLADLNSADRQQHLDALANAYGYTLGYEQNNKVYTRRNEHDPYYALVADAPNGAAKNLRSNNHGGCGQNVLFEDGHVRYVSDCRFGDLDDHFYTNANGLVGLGQHRNDAVIVPANYVLK